MQQSLTQQFIEYLNQRTITDADRQRSMRHVLDWIGCAALGKQYDIGSIYGSILDWSAASDATSIMGRKGNWQDVLQHNAALGNVLEMDDVHRTSILHAGPVVIPTALCLSEMLGSAPTEFLDAIIKGYEATIRLGQSIGRTHYQYFHNTSTCSAIGAAVAAGSLLKLSPKQMRSAIGNTLSRTGGLWQMRHEKVDTKQWHNAEAARSGAMAALLAARGMRGPKFILEGEQGIYAALSHDADPDMFMAKHDHWLIYDCSFKPWPACRHAHPAIDAIRKLLQQHVIQNDDIDSIRIDTYEDAIKFCHRPTPTSEIEAKFSIEHAISALLLRGEPRLEHYYSDTFYADDIVAMRGKVSLNIDDKIEADYPQHFGARVTVKLKTGDVITAQIVDTLGDPENPLSEAEVEEKARMLMTEAGMSAEQMDAIVSCDWVASSSIDGLTRLLQQQGK